MKNIILLKKFLEKNSNDNLLKYLTEEEISKLKNIKPFSKIEIKKEDIIDIVHYSWFIPFLNFYSDKEAALFLQALKPVSKKSLLELLQLKDIKEEINPILKKFLKEELTKSLIKKEDTLLPIEYLLESKLNILLTLNKKQLIKLIDYLSLYDFIKEIKFIVDKEKLKKIYSYFTKDEKDYINSLFNYVEPFQTQRFSIEKFLNNKKKFRASLHIRGLMRLSIALSSETLDLIWWVCHYLDIGRGNYLLKNCKKEKKSNISDAIKAEILKIIKVIKEKEIL